VATNPNPFSLNTLQEKKPKNRTFASPPNPKSRPNPNLSKTLHK
jgi:hypothetical protein